MPSDANAGRGRVVRLLTSPAARFTLLAVLVGGLLLAVVLVGGPSKARIERLVRAAGMAAPLAYLAAYVALTVLMFPASIVTAASGVLFGTWLGTLLSVVGATVGATASFLIGRRLGREQVGQMVGGRVARLDDWLGRHGFLAILYLRLVAVVPFNVLNYAAGVTAVRRRDYVVATAVGIIPGTFAYAALGGNLDDPTSPEFFGALALIVVLAVGGPLVNRVLRRRGRAPDASELPAAKQSKKMGPAS